MCCIGRHQNAATPSGEILAETAQNAFSTINFRRQGCQVGVSLAGWDSHAIFTKLVDAVCFSGTKSISIFSELAKM